MIYVYVLKSKKDGRWYTGFTHDLRKRLKEHNANTERATKNRGPFDVIYYEACVNEQDARAREKFLKIWTRQEISSKSVEAFPLGNGVHAYRASDRDRDFHVGHRCVHHGFHHRAGVQARQTSAAAVNEESLSLLQRVQYYVELSSQVSSTQDVATSTLTLRMPSSSIDPTVISLLNGPSTSSRPAARFRH